MKAFMKDDNTLIINTMIEPNEKEQFIKFVEKAVDRPVRVLETYDSDGNVSGVMIKLT
jgi:hypothetical protein